jgi:hypothetical protein
MAQHDYVIANGTGAAVRSDINNGLAAIVSNNSGATEPATMYAYQWWADTTTGLLKIRNAANNGWVTVGTLASANLGLLASAGTLTAALGSASTPGITFTGDTNTGIYSPGADQVAVATSGTGRLFVDSSGQVGLATSSPAVAFQVGATGSGGAAIDTTNSTLHGTFGTGGSLSLRAQISSSSGGGDIFLGGSSRADANVNSIVFSTANTSRAKIDENGYFTVSSNRFNGFEFIDGDPTIYHSFGSGGSLKLRVQTTATAGGGEIFLGGSTRGDSYVNAIVFSGANTERARIDSSGRLLVGTSSYAGNGKLIAAGNTGGNAGTLDICWAGSRPTAANTDIGYLRWYSADNSSGNAHYASIYASSDGASSSGSDIPGRLVFSTTADGASSPTERMRIRNNGQICINDTAGYNSGFLNVLGGSATTVGISIKCIADGNFGMSFHNAAGSNVGNITIDGASTAFNTSSDYRLKENIVPLTGAIDRVSSLQVHRFNFISDPEKTVDGFIAHEAQQVVPECVTGTKDEVDADGNPKYQSIDQSKLVPLLTAALQEALAEIESLKARVTALEP